MIHIDNKRKLWLTADLHFTHLNIIKYCNRPFSSAEDMDRALIENWNRVVGHDDMVLVLGDFTFKYERFGSYQARLSGEKIFFRGNHDPKMAMADVGMVFYKHTKIWCSHYAHAIWPENHRGAFHAFGHSHNGFTQAFKGSFDVGVDSVAAFMARGSRPISPEHYVPISFEDFVRNVKNENKEHH
jgi:calcineurin-like phosphoesterase family protein